MLNEICSEICRGLYDDEALIFHNVSQIYHSYPQEQDHKATEAEKAHLNILSVTFPNANCSTVASTWIIDCSALLRLRHEPFALHLIFRFVSGLLQLESIRL